MTDIKPLLVKLIGEKLSEKITELSDTISELKKSGENESKSSAGDKYETGREMVQQELNKCFVQLELLKKQQHELKQIDLSNPGKKITPGSLVETDSGNYFVSVAFGSVPVNSTNIHCVSTGSPLIMAMHMKKEGDTLIFRDLKIKIKNIF